MSTPATLITIPNHHGEDAGATPAIIPGKNQYIGYFENEHGEQWVFVYDRQTHEGTLRGGDAGWDESYEVIEGMALELILSANESNWLRLCWDTATTWEK